MNSATRLNRRFFARLFEDRSGLALMEFAFTLPFMLALSLTGAELTNYTITRMRVSQLALHIADNAARIGSGSQMQLKKISEADINDLLTGAGLQAGSLDLYERGRVVISDLEPIANPNPTNKFHIEWQRCRGTKTTYNSMYKTQFQTDELLDGIGEDKDDKQRLATAIEGGATMFVEVFYEYRPLIKTSILPSSMVETAAMMVRDNRDLSDDSAKGASATHPHGIYQVSGVTPSTCY